jgi:hypothetical protein
MMQAMEGRLRKGSQGGGERARGGGDGGEGRGEMYGVVEGGEGNLDVGRGRWRRR